MTHLVGDPCSGGLNKSKDQEFLLALFFRPHCARASSACQAKKIKPDAQHRAFDLFAVRGGFEPPEQFPVRQFSKLVVSATHPPHRLGVQIYALSHFFQAV